MFRRGLLIAAVVVVSTAAIGIFINYATPTPPTWLTADPWRPWLFLALAVLFAVVLALFAARSIPATAASTTIRLSPATPSPRFQAAPSSLTPPHVDPKQVLGRDVELRQIVRLLTPQPTEGSDRFVVVAGAGGIGKTTLAAAAAVAARQAGRQVVWLRWRSLDGPDSLAARMVEAASVLGLPVDQAGVAQQAGSSLVDLVWGHLNATPDWMLVIDDLDLPNAAALVGDRLADYRGWIRPSRTGLLVVTSRDQDTTTWGVAAQLISLGPLDAEASAQLLLAAAPHGGTLEEAVALATRLGGLPLALYAASAVVGEPTSALRSFAAYQQALASCSLSVLPDLPARPDLADQNTARSLVGHTWELSLDQLDAEGLGMARPLLRLLALFAEAPIPRPLLATQLAAQVTGQTVSATTLNAAVTGLRRYGLLDTPDLTRTHQIVTLALHPLVRETSVLLLEQHTDSTPWREALSSWLIEQVSQTAATGRIGWDYARLLAPHVLQLIGPHSEKLDTFRPARDALNTLAKQLRQAGAYAAALGLYQRCLHAEELMLGAAHPDTLNSRNNLAFVLRDRGEYQRVLQLHEQTLAVRERVLGPEHPDTLNSRNNLANVLRDLGEYQRAAQLHEQTLSAREQVLGREHTDTLKSSNNLANALRDLGEYRRAAQLYRRAAQLHEQTLTIRERVLGPEHPDTLNSRNNLADALYGLGKYQQVVQLHEQTLAARERVLGPDHPDTLNSRNNLAAALSDGGEYERAVKLHEQTLAARERVLGPEHPDTLGSRNNLALALGAGGEYEQAVKLHEQTLAARERVLGPEHPDTLKSRNNLALALRDGGEYEQAVKLHEQTLAARERVLGPDHPDTLNSRNNLAAALSDGGEYERVAQLHEQALAIRERVLGTDHPDTLNSSNNLANVLRDLGQYQRAAQLHEQTLAIRERVLGTDHPDTLNSRNNLAGALRRAQDERCRSWWPRRRGINRGGDN
ncbi:MAG: tetratricopeptide repeat protein [Pseudonocardiaceae bacterium]